MFGDVKGLLSIYFIFAQYFISTYATTSIATTVGGNSLQQGQGNGGPLFNVTRVFNSGDVFSNADPRCEPKTCLVLGATVIRSSPCHCQCPNKAPAFLQHIRQCANSIDECRMVEFNQSGTRQKIPTLFLPLSGQSIATSSPIDWEGAGIQIRSDNNDTLPCSVSGSGYLTQNGWIQLDSEGIFSLQSTYLKWLGSKQDQLLLTGKVVQVTFRCVRGKAVDLCAVFRVIGKDVTSLSADGLTSPQLGASVLAGSTSSNERANQLGLIVGIVCGALLAVTLVSVAVFWTVCWKQQKERLTRKIQLHVLYQQQRMQQQAAAGAFPHLANAFNTMNEPAVSSTIEMLQSYGGVAYAPYLENGQQQVWLDSQQQQRQNEEMARRYMHDQRGGLLMASNPNGSMLDPRSAQSASDQLILPPPPPYPHARKKLYFSPDFFDPDLMLDPPPVAEEFLYEVRRMIDLAKNRIRSRRYLPSLLVIPEEGNNRPNNGMEANRKISELSTNSSSSYGGRSNAILERRDSFSKMAQEPAPEEALTIRELEHEREQAESPRSSGSADSRTANDSSDGPPSSSSGCDGAGDRSSGEAIVSLDSGLGGDEDSSKKSIANSNRNSSQDENHGDKVTHWLSRLPPTIEIDEGDLQQHQSQQNGRHSKLYDYFNARQRLGQNNNNQKSIDRSIIQEEEDDRNNIIRVQVNEQDQSQQDHSPGAASNNDSLPRRRYSVPLIDGGGLSSSAPIDQANIYWQYKRPELAASASANAYFEQQRLRQQGHVSSDRSIDQLPNRLSSLKSINRNGPSSEWGSTADQRRTLQMYGSEGTALSSQPRPGSAYYEQTINRLPSENHFELTPQANGVEKLHYGRPVSTTQNILASSASSSSTTTSSLTPNPSHQAYLPFTRDQQQTA